MSIDVPQEIVIALLGGVVTLALERLVVRPLDATWVKHSKKRAEARAARDAAFDQESGELARDPSRFQVWFSREVVAMLTFSFMALACPPLGLGGVIATGLMEDAGVSVLVVGVLGVLLVGYGYACMWMTLRRLSHMRDMIEAVRTKRSEPPTRSPD